MLNFQPTTIKYAPILNYRKQSTSINNSGSLNLKTLNEDLFQKSISFTSKKKKTRELIHNGIKFLPDGNISLQKRPLYEDKLESVIKPILTPEEQDTFQQFFINRNHDNEKNTLGQNGLPDYIKMNSLSQKLYNHGMNLEHTDPERITFFFLKDEIVKSPEYKEIAYKNPLIYNNQLYIPDSKNTLETQSLAKQTYNNIIKTGLNEQNANTFKLFFIDNQQESIPAKDLMDLESALNDASYNTDEQSKNLFSFFNKCIKSSPIYQKKELEYKELEQQRWNAIDQAIDNGNVDAYYNLINKENEYEVRNFCDFTYDKMQLDHNVYMRIAEEITGVEFVKKLYDKLSLFAKLGMPLPDEINANFEELESPEHKGKTIKAGNYKVCFNTNDNQIIHSSIHINKELFDEEFQKNTSRTIKNIFDTFYHEMGHHLHATNALEKFNCGIDEILTDEEKNIFNTFNKKIKQLAVKINRPQLDCFDTNQGHDIQNDSHQIMEYNMSNFEFNWNFVLKLIEYDRSNATDEFNIAFPIEFTEKLKPVMQKLVDAIETIKENLPNNKYALCTPAETIAEASKEELNGHYLTKDFRALLYQLGKPTAPNMCYLDEHNIA